MTLVHAAARREASGCVHLMLVNNANRPVQATVSFELGTLVNEVGRLRQTSV